MLERIPKLPPKIAPLAHDVNGPVWSVMIPSYNCINYLKDTINSVLLQAPSIEEMQIEVIDDDSTDGDVETLVNVLGKGRVGFFKQSKNVGHLRNFETCINRAKGKLVHILHGDDVVKVGFYEELARLFNDHPNIGAAFTHCIDFDKNNTPLWTSPKILEKPGIIDNLLLKLAEKSLLQPSSIVVKRSVYEDLGSFYGGSYGEDWLMWTRIAAHYEVAYSPKSLANYRVHTNNITGSSLATGQNIKDIRKVIETIQKYLPEKQRKSLKRKAKRNYSTYLSTTVNWLYHYANNHEAALLQAKQAFIFYPSILTFSTVLKVSFKKLIRYKMKS